MRAILFLVASVAGFIYGLHSLFCGVGDRDGSIVVAFIVGAVCILLYLAFLDKDLLYYVRCGSPSMVKFMLRLWANPSAEDAQGKPALQLAEEGGYTEVAAVLREALVPVPCGRVADGEQPEEPQEPATPPEIGAERAPACVPPPLPASAIGDGTGGTELMRAVRRLDAKHVKDLLAGGADPNEADDSGLTPLRLAVDAGRKDIAGVLLRSGGYSPVMADDGLTPLQAAACMGDPALVSLMLDLGAGGLRKEIGAALIHARAHGHDLAASLLENALDFAQDPDAKEPTGQAMDAAALTRALVEACRLGDASRAKRLIKLGAPLDAHAPDGRSPLIAAAEGGYTHIIHALCRAGADVDAVDAAGATPLMYACMGGKRAAAEALVGQGADITLKDAQGRTAEFVAKEHGETGLADYLHGLLG